MGRNALQIAKLVEAQPQRKPDFRVQAQDAAGVVLDQKVELGLEPQDAENQFVRQGRIPWVQRPRAGEQKVGGITAPDYLQQDVKCSGTCG